MAIKKMVMPMATATTTISYYLFIVLATGNPFKINKISESEKD